MPSLDLWEEGKYPFARRYLERVRHFFRVGAREGPNLPEKAMAGGFEAISRAIAESPPSRRTLRWLHAQLKAAGEKGGSVEDGRFLVVLVREMERYPRQEWWNASSDIGMARYIAFALSDRGNWRTYVPFLGAMLLEPFWFEWGGSALMWETIVASYSEGYFGLPPLLPQVLAEYVRILSVDPDVLQSLAGEWILNHYVKQGTDLPAEVRCAMRDLVVPLFAPGSLEDLMVVSDSGVVRRQAMLLLGTNIFGTSPSVREAKNGLLATSHAPPAEWLHA